MGVGCVVVGGVGLSLPSLSEIKKKVHISRISEKGVL